MNTLRCIVSLLNYNSVYWAFFAVLALHFSQGGILTPEFISPMTVIIGCVFQTTGYVPYAMNSFIDCSVSGARMTEFLRTYEVKPIRKDMVGGDENTNGNLKLTKGNFTWSRRFVELLEM